MASRVVERARCRWDRPGSVKSAKGRSAAARLLLLLLLVLKRPPTQLKSKAFLTLPHITPRAEGGALSDEDADADAPPVLPARGGACGEGRKRGGVV